MSGKVFRSVFERRLGAVESHIESEFLSAFCTCAFENGYECQKRPAGAGVIGVIPQFLIDRYRADFRISYEFYGTVAHWVVECDGHAFHERTKEQAKRDRRRDRELQALDYRVLRFTGSEINADPNGCAMEVLNQIMDFQTDCLVEATDATEAA